MSAGRKSPQSTKINANKDRFNRDVASFLLFDNANLIRFETICLHFSYD